MMRNVILAVTIVSSLVASTAQADHQRGGSRGGGWGGSGFQLNIGRGGFGYGNGWGRGNGWGDNGWGDNGWGNNGWGGNGWGYYSPGYYGQTYSSPNYYTPSQVYTGSTVVPSGPQAPMFDGGSIVLTNPATNTGTVNYSLNGQPFVMRPGQSQRFTHERDWIVEFNRGDGSSIGRYSLKSATYKFKPTARGWELFEQAESRPTVGALPPPPSDDGPVKSADRPRLPNPPTPPVPEADEPKPLEFTGPSSEPETVVRPRQVPQP